MNARVMIILILLIISLLAYTQEERLEFIAERSLRELDFSDLTGILEHYRENPMNINKATSDEILSLQILEPIHVQNLIEYIEKYGSLLTEYELLAIDGFNREMIQQLMPYITLQPSSKETTPQSKRHRFRYQLITRYSRLLEQQKGYEKLQLVDWQERPNDRYIGSPDRIYIRNILSWNNQIKFGFTLDKNAGEAMFPKHLPDTIAGAVNTGIAIPIESFTSYAYAQDIRFIKKVVLGDYHLQFGQGLTMWSGMSYSKSADVINIKRYASTIRPNTSTNANGYMRGGAAWLQFGRIGIVAFYSNLIPASGYHRTFNEIKKEHAPRVINYGARVQYHHDNFKLGMTGNLAHQDIGLDFDVLLFKNTNLFGEITSDQNRSIAFMAGMVSMLHPKVSIAMIYRYYPLKLNNIYSSGFSEAGSTQNETGFYIGMSVNPIPNITFKAYADLYRFPWIRYQVDAPSSGYDMLLQMNYILSSNVQLYLRYRTEIKQKNHPDLMAYIDPLSDIKKSILRFHIAYQVSDNLQLRNRIEWNNVYPGNQSGFLIYQDFILRPVSKAYQLIARLALFDTDTYLNRIYAYENNVLYASSVPSYYGQGSRIYIIFKLKFTSLLEAWVRVAQTYYHDRTIIGTGLEEIHGRTKTEVRLQVRLKI